MTDLTPRRGPDRACQGRLYLVFRVAGQRFALDSREVAEVLPRLPLKPIPRSPAWVSGVLAHRGKVIPVIDISALTFGEPAPQRTSTRLVLVHYRVDPSRQDLLLGLILEQASNTQRIDPAEFRPYHLDNRDAPYLGPVREDAQGMLQWIGVQDLLNEDVRALLFPADGAEVQP